MSAPPCPYEVSEYALRLDVDFAQQRWTGTVECELRGSAPRIALDCVRLEILEALVDGRAVPHRLDPAAEQLILEAPITGRAAVRIGFAGHVDPNLLMGLYRSRYGPSYILTTQCEAAAARQIFPCLDRPDRKARLRLTVVTDAGPTVITNMPPERIVPDGTRRRWEFPPTPPMATYLFYLGIGTFDRLEAPPGRVAMAIHAPPGRREEGRRALEVCRISLEELERYYGIPYPLPKLDLIAVPEFPAGAMENWGAISFRDMQVLINPATPSSEMRYTVATIAHEVAHQWFGNLVTPYWWNDIWLNESFATFVEHKVVERRFPELESLQDFLSIWTRWGFLLDSLPTNHPILVDVSTPAEVGAAIDRLTYGKGASVLRMIEAFVGESGFQRGVSAYLQRHAGGNARSEDLWSALDAATGTPVARILRPWIEAPGHPVIEAESVPEGLRLRQRPFAFRPTGQTMRWPVPLVLDIGGREHRVLMEEETLTVPAPPGATIHLNPGAVGFYRSRYDPVLTERLLASFAQRPPSDRWSVLEDLWAFLLSGDADLAEYGRFVRALAGATDYLCVGSTAAHLDTLYAWAGDLAPAAELVREFLRAHGERVGTQPRPGESSMDGSLRDTLLRARVRADPSFARALSARFAEWDRLDANVRPATAIAYAMVGGASAYAEIRRRLEAAPSQTEALRFETALAWTSDPSLLQETLRSALGGGINKGNVPRVLSAAAQNPSGRSIVWPWLEANLPELVRRYEGTTLLGDFLEASVSILGLADPERVRAYFRTHSFPTEEKFVRRALDMLDLAEGLRHRLAAHARR
ncbi:MAG: M1 family metallopeptidase [Thermoplasmata archaeon]